MGRGPFRADSLPELGQAVEIGGRSGDGQRTPSGCSPGAAFLVEMPVATRVSVADGPLGSPARRTTPAGRDAAATAPASGNRGRIRHHAAVLRDLLRVTRRRAERAVPPTGGRRQRSTTDDQHAKESAEIHDLLPFISPQGALARKTPGQGGVARPLPARERNVRVCAVSWSGNRARSAGAHERSRAPGWRPRCSGWRSARR